jgi:hypothetical protein
MARPAQRDTVCAPLHPEIPIMVNRPLPRTVAICLTLTGIAEVPANRGSFAFAKTLQKPASRAFAQILGKLHFVQLGENLRRILLDYAKKRPRPANATFNAAC